MEKIINHHNLNNLWNHLNDFRVKYNKNIILKPKKYITLCDIYEYFDNHELLELLYSTKDLHQNLSTSNQLNDLIVFDNMNEIFKLISHIKFTELNQNTNINNSSQIKTNYFNREIPKIKEKIELTKPIFEVDAKDQKTAPVEKK